MRGFFVVIVIALFLKPEASNAVTLRAGEHGSFTRITAQIGTGTDWSVTDVIDGIAVDFGKTAGRISLDRVFDRIDRSRVKDIKLTSSEGSIIIKLNCRCGHRVLLDENGLLIVDISENFFSDLTLRRPLESRLSDALPGFQVPSMMVRQSEVRKSLQEFWDASEFFGYPSEDEMHSGNLFRDMEGSAELSQQDSMFLRSLINSIGDSAKQGILVAKDISEQIDNEIVTEQNFDHSSIYNPHRSLTFAGVSAVWDENSEKCPEPEVLDIASWGYSTGFSEGIAELYSRLSIEFDKENSDVLLKIIRHFLHYGFGAEALAILDVEGDRLLEDEFLILQSIAEIIEERPTTFFLEDQIAVSCSGLATLWSVLSGDLESGYPNIDSEGLILAFDGLPPHLKKLFLTRLAINLVKYGHDQAASDLLDIARQSSIYNVDEIDWIKEFLSLNNSATAESLHVLSQIATSPEGTRALALGGTVDALVPDNSSFGNYDSEVVGSYYFEFRDSTVEPTFARAYVVSLLYSDHFLEAAQEIGKESSSLSASLREELAEILLDRAISRLPDHEFLIFASMMPKQILNERLENLMAQHILSLGFPDLAISFIEGVATLNAGEDRRILRARALLDLEKFAEASAQLLGLSGPEVDEIRRQIIQSESNVNFEEALNDQLSRENSPSVTTFTDNSLEIERDFDRSLSNVPDDGIDDVQQRGANLSQPGALSVADQLIFSSEETRKAIAEMISRVPEN